MYLFEITKLRTFGVLLKTTVGQSAYFIRTTLVHAAWLGWLGWVFFYYFIFIIVVESIIWRAFRLFFKTKVEHFVCCWRTNLVHSVRQGWLGWACSHDIVFIIFLKNKRMTGVSSVKKQLLAGHIWGIPSAWAGWAGLALNISFPLLKK